MVRSAITGRPYRIIVRSCTLLKLDECNHVYVIMSYILGTAFSNAFKKDIGTARGLENFALGELLVLPHSFGSVLLYLLSTFKYNHMCGLP